MSSIKQIKKERKIKYIVSIVSVLSIIIVILQNTDSFFNTNIYSFFDSIFTYCFLPVVLLLICVIGIISDNKAIKYYEIKQQE
ncbi:Uncharacterised protein [Campylobacter insulaenigrae]|nr:Uncharacterised protein [Campylobacter insulaenigrae]